jgi:hypothetical protein
MNDYLFSHIASSSYRQIMKINDISGVWLLLLFPVFLHGLEGHCSS